MTAFGSYSRYYDLLYGDKDYRAESHYVEGLIRRYAPQARTILELGCGTGGHAVELANAGYRVHGVDFSTGMLERANLRREAFPADRAERLSFSRGDLRDIHLVERFDAIVSLFHVLSYQTSNSDLFAAFATAREHLEPEGIFLFDCWYGPGVLTEPPEVREKCIENSSYSLRRVAEPVMRSEENVVEVNYTLHIRDKKTGSDETIRESHRMRYLFRPEIELLMQLNGMTLIAARDWMSDDEPNLASWSACFVGKG